VLGRGASRRAPRGVFLLLFLFVLLSTVAGSLLLLRKSDSPPARDWRYADAERADRNGDNTLALRILDSILTDDPKDLRAHRLAAKAATALHQPLLAAAHLVSILKQDPEDYEATLSLASAYEQAGQADLAVPQYEAATRLRPDDPLPWKAAGLLSAGRGDVALAMAFLLRAYELDPRDHALLDRVASLRRPEPLRQTATANGVAGPLPQDPLAEIRRSRRPK